jgi:hypothetical protein
MSMYEFVEGFIDQLSPSRGRVMTQNPKWIVALIVWLLALPMIALAPAHAQNAAHQICPPGYNLMAEVCISETGDVVMPRDKK